LSNWLNYLIAQLSITLTYGNNFQFSKLSRPAFLVVDDISTPLGLDEAYYGIIMAGGAGSSALCGLAFVANWASAGWTGEPDFGDDCGYVGPASGGNDSLGTFIGF
jgi:hypothetical protein